MFSLKDTSLPQGTEYLFVCCFPLLHVAAMRGCGGKSYKPSAISNQQSGPSQQATGTRQTCSMC